MLIQEGILNLTSTEGDRYHLYYSGHENKSIHGLGIIVEYKTKDVLHLYLTEYV